MTKMRYLDAAQPCPQGTAGPLPVVGNPRSVSGLAADGNRHLPPREREATELLSGGARDWGQFLCEQGSWQGEGLRVQPRTPWSCGQRSWRLLSPCNVSRAGAVASSQMLRIPVSYVPSFPALP